MPWAPADSVDKTKKATTPKKRAQWAAIANKLLASGASEGDAIRQASGVIKRPAGPPAAPPKKKQPAPAPPMPTRRY